MAKCDLCGVKLNKEEEKILSAMMMDISPCMCSFAQEIYELRRYNKQLEDSIIKLEEGDRKIIGKQEAEIERLRNG